jgi:thiol-disulfide isomerase/thioredoxin
MKKMRRLGSMSLLLGIASLALVLAASAPTLAQNEGNGRPVLYLFWGDGCPHCAAEKAFLELLSARQPALVVRAYEVWGNRDNQAILLRMAQKFGFEPEAVPITFVGNQYWVGYSESIGAQIEQAVAQCAAAGCPDAGAAVISPAAPVPTAAILGPVAPAPPMIAVASTIELPLIGAINLAQQSLLVSTALIALVDGFNPCSLWALTVLLAITLHTGSRRRVAVIGLIYISITALIYALFIAGLFTAFTFVNVSGWLRIVVAGVALAFAAINIKDYFAFKQGMSLSIPESKKPGLYRQMRALADPNRSMWSLVGGTVVLAAGVSLVEFSCTAGFPMLWTNLLTTQAVTGVTFIALLVVYLLIYQLDELLIFAGAVATMKATRMEERHGRALKLASGMLMLALAVVMLVNPALMNSLSSALLIFAAAAAATLLVMLLDGMLRPRRASLAKATAGRHHAPRNKKASRH